MDYLRDAWGESDSSLWLALVRLLFGIVWLRAGLEKLGPEFAKALPGTLGFFASKNPHTWMAKFLTGTAIPNAGFYATAVAWGEIIVGVFLIVGFLTNISAFVGMFMNFMYFYAAGWTGPATAEVNLIMFFIQLVLILSYGAKVFGVDHIIARSAPGARGFLTTSSLGNSLGLGGARGERRKVA